MNYKKGDRVVRLFTSRHYDIFQPAVIIEKCSKFKDDYLVITRVNGIYTKLNWNKIAFMPYEVYKSKLYKTMKEDEIT